MQYEKTLLTVDEFCQYVGIGKTKARELISNPCCKYVVRIGRRVFIHKELFNNICYNRIVTGNEMIGEHYE
mgnify:CR=1 FL=1